MDYPIELPKEPEQSGSSCGRHDHSGILEELHALKLGKHRILMVTRISYDPATGTMETEYCAMLPELSQVAVSVVSMKDALKKVVKEFSGQKPKHLRLLPRSSPAGRP